VMGLTRNRSSRTTSSRQLQQKAAKHPKDAKSFVYFRSAGCVMMLAAGQMGRVTNETWQFGRFGHRLPLVVVPGTTILHRTTVLGHANQRGGPVYVRPRAASPEDLEVWSSHRKTLGILLTWWDGRTTDCGLNIHVYSM
jgi:hypothetical protein